MTTPIAQSESTTHVLTKIFNTMLQLHDGIKKTPNQVLRYSYFENDDVVTAIRTALLDNRLLLLVSGSDVTEHNTRYFQSFTYTFHCPDTGEWMAFGWGGAYPCQQFSKDKGMIEDDKAVGKLESYANKYFLLKFFKIGTPDQDTEAVQPPQRNSQPYDATHMRNNADSRPQYPTPNQTSEQRKLATTPPAPLPPPAQDIEPLSDTIEPDDNGIGDEKSVVYVNNQQLAALHIYLQNIGISDEEKHKLILLFTNNRTQSSKELTAAEFKIFMKLLKLWELGSHAGDSWIEASQAIASKVSGKRTTSLFQLMEYEIDKAHKQTLAWLYKKNVAFEARFEQL